MYWPNLRAQLGRQFNLQKLQVAFEIDGKTSPTSWEVAVRQVLRTLTALRLVEVDASATIRLTDLWYGITPALEIKRRALEGSADAASDGDANGNIKNPPPADPDDGDAGGAGVREVLAHPHLF